MHNLTPPTPQHRYSLHGLIIASELELPELTPSSSNAQHDVAIVRGSVPDSLDGPTCTGLRWQVGLGAFLFEVEGLARYLVSDGKQITVEAVDASTGGAGDVRLYLLGTGIGCLLHQRGLLPLHASAVATPSGTWAFTGPSGAGKSTIAAWLKRREGWPVLSDDVIVVDDSRPEPRLQVGPPRIKLWRDALESLDIATDGLVRDMTRLDKFHVVTTPTDANTGGSFRALVLLDVVDGDEPAELLPMRGHDAVAVVMASVYRMELAEHLRSPGELFLQCARLAGQIRVFRFRRPRSLGGFDAALGPLLDGIIADAV